MGILRKLVSFLVLVAGIVVLVGLCINPEMKVIWSAFSKACNPFSFTELAKVLGEFFMITGNAIVLIMLGFIGISIPSSKR